MTTHSTVVTERNVACCVLKSQSRFIVPSATDQLIKQLILSHSHIDSPSRIEIVAVIIFSSLCNRTRVPFPYDCGLFMSPASTAPSCDIRIGTLRRVNRPAGFFFSRETFVSLCVELSPDRPFFPRGGDNSPEPVQHRHSRQGTAQLRHECQG